MKLKNFFKNFGGRFISTCIRFQLPIALIIALTAYSLVQANIDGNIISDTFSTVSVWYLTVASLLMLSTVLWIENDEKPDKLKIIIAVAAHAGLLVMAALLAFKSHIDGASGIAMGAVTLLIIVSVFYLSFIGCKTDLPTWNFATRLIFNFIVAYIVALVLMGGVTLLLQSFKMLFGLSVPDKAYIDAAVLCFTLIAPFLFLLLLPPKSEKYNGDIVLSRFGRGVLHYLFIPLLAAYCIVLYGYAFKIIASWTLPVGWVSYLVSALMLGAVVVIALLYPIRFSDEEKNIDRAVFKWLPILILPLLLLMTVGICRRVGDYGITISRLYLILFNIWCYAVCIFLIIGKCKRIRWIPVSFAVLLFFASVGPQNFTATTRRVLQKQVMDIMREGGETEFPLDSAAYEALLQRLDNSQAKKVDDKLYYLYSNYEKESATEAIVDSTVYVGEYLDSVYTCENASLSASYSRDLGVLDIPEGYTKVYQFNNPGIFPVQGADSLKIVVSVPEGKDSLTGEKEFLASKSVLRRADESRPIILIAEDAMAFLNYYYIDFSSDTLAYNSMEGLLFFK